MYIQASDLEAGDKFLCCSGSDGGGKPIDGRILVRNHERIRDVDGMVPGFRIATGKPIFVRSSTLVLKLTF